MSITAGSTGLATDFINANADQSQLTQNATTKVGEANATTKQNKLAQSFTTTVTRMKGVILYKSADTGSFTGTVTIALQANSSGSPSGSNLASITLSNANWLRIPVGAFEVPFSAEYDSLTISTLYWIVISTSTSDNSNHPNLGTNSAGGYASGSAKYNNTTDGWVAIATIDLYFSTIIGTIGAALIGDSSGRLPTNALPFSFVDMNTTNASLSNDGTETTVYTYILSSQFFTTTSGFRISGFASRVQPDAASGGSVNITAYINNTSVVQISIGSGANGLNMAGIWSIVMVNNSSFSSQKTVARTQLQIVGDPNSTSLAGINQTDEATSSIDTTGINILKITYQNTATAVNCRWAHDNILLEKIG